MQTTIRFVFPLPRTHCGVALGNGLCGALVWGDDKLYITVNRADFWDHRGGELMGEGSTYEAMKEAFDPDDPSKLERAFVRPPQPEKSLRSSRLPAGRFEISFKDAWRPVRADLDFIHGQLRVDLEEMEQGGAGRDITLSLHPQKPVLWIRDIYELIEEVTPRPAWEWVGVELEKFDFEPPRIIEEDGIDGWIQACPADDAFAAVCRKNDTKFLIALECDEEDVVYEKAIAQIYDAEQAGGVQFSSEVYWWWNEYWSRVPQVKLPDYEFTELLNYALFKFAGATNPNCRLPAGLQGPWVEEYQLTPWSGDYHFNVNIQQIYSLAFASNNLDHALPLFDLIDSWRPQMQRQAKILVGIDDGLTLGHAVDDRGLMCGGISAGSCIDIAVAGWTGQLYWWYYTHSGDLDFLRERAYPFMAGVMRVYEEMLEDDGTKLSLPIGISAEYFVDTPTGYQRVGRNPSVQLSCIHMLTEALLKAASLLGIEPRPIWQEIRERLPHFTTQGDAGKERIALWEGQELEKSHRHFSHLSSIYPFDTLPDWSEETAALVKRTLDHWIFVGMSDWSEWAFPWAAIIQARCDRPETPYVLLKLWRDIYVNEGLATVYIPRIPGVVMHRDEFRTAPHPWSPDQTTIAANRFETQEIMQLDGTMAYASAIYEMLVQSRRGVVHIFPGVPAQWRDVRFERIRVPGPFLVSATRQDGALKEIRVQALRGGRLRLVIHDDTQLQCLKGDTRFPVGPNARSEVVMKLAEGEEISFCAAG